LRSVGLSGIAGYLISTVVDSCAMLVGVGEFVGARGVRVCMAVGVKVGQGVYVGPGAVQVHPVISSRTQARTTV
jgi:hypothetical protein